MRKRGQQYAALRSRARRLVAADRKLVDDLAAIRRRKGISDETVAQRMGITIQYLEAIEGDTADPTLGQMRRYAHAIGVVVEHHIKDDEPDTKDSVEPVAVVHKDGTFECSSIPVNPAYGPIYRITPLGTYSNTETQAEIKVSVTVK